MEGKQSDESMHAWVEWYTQVDGSSFLGGLLLSLLIPLNAESLTTLVRQKSVHSGRVKRASGYRGQAKNSGIGSHCSIVGTCTIAASVSGSRMILKPACSFNSRTYQYVLTIRQSVNRASVTISSG